MEITGAGSEQQELTLNLLDSIVSSDLDLPESGHVIVGRPDGEYVERRRAALARKLPPDDPLGRQLRRFFG